MKINASLLREKYIIREETEILEEKGLYITAPSTRMPISLQAGTLAPEEFIIRTNNMHTCARMVSRIVYDYDKNGPIMARAIPMDWEQHWDDTLNNYERAYNENRWVCIYNKGKPVFSDGEHHPFFDVIEKCDAVNKKDYSSSLALAEDAFRKAGKSVKISYDTNVALVADLERQQGRCSMILRGPDRKTTFNFYIKTEDERQKISVPQCLAVSAAFLEGVQLSYFIGFGHEKMRIGLIEKYSEEHKQIREAQQRINQLNAEISAFENRYKVRYRPERPVFQDIIQTTEKIAKKTVINEDEVYID